MMEERYELGFIPDFTDCQYIIADIRQDDLLEWTVGGSGRQMLPLLKQSLSSCAGSCQAVRRRWTGQTLCLWGVNPETGVVWMVATNEAQRQGRRLQRLYRAGIAFLHAQTPKDLQAWSLETNTLHHDWMERLGFTRTGAAMSTPLGLRFLQFTRKPDVL